MLLASCKGEFSPQEVDGYQFTGDGIFGDAPYLCAQHYSSLKAGDTINVKQCDKSLDVEIEVMVKGEKESTAKMEVHVSDTIDIRRMRKPSTGEVREDTFCIVQITTMLPESLQKYFEGGLDDTKMVSLDKNGVIITSNSRPGLNVNLKYEKDICVEEMYREFLSDMNKWDRVHKIVLTDDAGLKELTEKSVEAMIQNLTDEQKQTGKGDLAAFDLRGKVKWASIGDNVYNFDENGKLVKISLKSVDEVYQDLKRDKQGRLSSYTKEPEEEFGLSSSTKLVYDDKTGFLKEEIWNGDGQTTTSFIRNEQFFVVKEHIKGEYTDMGADEATKFERPITYKYTAVDDHGNWTKRVATEGEETSEETRTIMYYE